MAQNTVESSRTQWLDRGLTCIWGMSVDQMSLSPTIWYLSSVSSDYIDILQDRPLVVPKVGVENILAIEFHASPA